MYVFIEPSEKRKIYLSHTKHTEQARPFWDPKNAGNESISYLCNVQLVQSIHCDVRPTTEHYIHSQENNIRNMI